MLYDTSISRLNRAVLIQGISYASIVHRTQCIGFAMQIQILDTGQLKNDYESH